MPDILIRGMEMPHGKDHITITINADGTVQKLMDVYCKTIGQAIELPPHGDLISRSDALAFPLANGKYDHENANKHFIFGCETYKEYLEQLPVIVPADKEVQDALS